MTAANYRPAPRSFMEGVAEAEAENDSHSIEGYFKYRFDQLKDASGKAPDGALLKAVAQKKELVKRQGPAPAAAGSGNAGWTWQGPGNVGGRIRAVLPIDANTVFFGSATGGLWKTTNCCVTSTTWSPIDDFLANLSIETLVVNPADGAKLYAGTGEINGGDGVRGAGVFSSTDGGNTWAQISSTDTADFYFVSRLAISSDGNTLHAATGSGIWRSTDGGSTWTQTLVVPSGVRDLRIDPSSSSKLVAGAMLGVAYYSTDSGATWTAATGFPALASQGRIELAYAESSSSVVYASLDNNKGDLYRSDDGGKTYALKNTGTQYLGTQGFWDIFNWVDPANPDHVVVGGLDIYQSFNAGTTLTQISKWQNSWPAMPASPHADHHAMVPIPSASGGAVINANDGGLYYTADITSAGNNSPDFNNGWVSLNKNLGITQFYGVSGNTNGVLYGGAQDNGTVVYTSSLGTQQWRFSDGGDGGKSASDPIDPDYMYNEYTFGTVYRSSDGGASTVNIYNTAGCNITDAVSGSSLFIAPILLDPNNANTLYVGTANLWRTTNAKDAGPCWGQAKTAVGTQLVSFIGVAPGISTTIWVGYDNGRIEKTIDGGANWNQVFANSTTTPGTQVSSIAIDRNDANNVFVGFTGFGPDRIWRTTDGGANWASATGNLPNAPALALAISPHNSAWIYAGTEIGIFASENSGGAWNVPAGTGKNGDGPANVPVFDLQWMGGANSTGTGKLILGTHGRGAFTIDTAQLPAKAFIPLTVR